MLRLRPFVHLTLFLSHLGFGLDDQSRQFFFRNREARSNRFSNQ
jgi:hypothetical protein